MKAQKIRFIMPKEVTEKIDQWVEKAVLKDYDSPVRGGVIIEICEKGYADGLFLPQKEIAQVAKVLKPIWEGAEETDLSCD
jgi:hypothetical protein